MSFSVNYLVFCVPTLHINNYRNRDIVLNTLIAEFITLCVKHHMAGKVPKSKDFYKVSLCSNTIVSSVVPDSKGNSFTSCPFTGTGKLNTMFLIQFPSFCFSGYRSIRSMNALINSFCSISVAAPYTSSKASRSW